MQGWSPDFISKLASDAVAAGLIDDTVAVGGSEAIETAIEIARTEGIFCGITGGATLAAALKFARSAEPGSRILAMLPDTGERYLSTPLFGEVGVEMNEDEAALLQSAMPAIVQAAAPAPVAAQPQQGSDEDARRFVAEAISSSRAKVVMFALSWCEFCWSARKLFARMQIPFVSVDLDDPDFRTAHDVQKIRSALQEITGAATIPQIFIGGEWIGGSMEVLEAAESGELQRLLGQSSIPFNHQGQVSRYDFLPNWVQKQPQAA
jgi:cysteine synthase A